MKLPKLSIVTPCLNADAVIEATVESVIGQSVLKNGRATLEYIICDGNSQDSTCRIVEKYCNSHDTMILDSRPDRGIYDALSRGLSQASGDIVAYINAGDIYALSAFDIVLDIMFEREVNWLTGYTTIQNTRGQITRVRLPYRYRKRFFLNGFYGTKLPFLQQESTFWTASLNALIDFDALSNFKLAGDFFIWKTFAEYARLHVVEAHLAGFTKHKGQLSEDLETYLREVREITRRGTIADEALRIFDFFVWVFFPNGWKAALNPDLITYDHEAEIWR